MSFPSLHVRQRAPPPVPLKNEREPTIDLQRHSFSEWHRRECETRRTSEKYGDAFLVCASHMHTHRHTNDCRIRLCT